MTSVYENGGEEAVWFTRLGWHCLCSLSSRETFAGEHFCEVLNWLNENFAETFLRFETGGRGVYECRHYDRMMPNPVPQRRHLVKWVVNTTIEVFHNNWSNNSGLAIALASSWAAMHKYLKFSLQASSPFLITIYTILVSIACTSMGPSACNATYIGLCYRVGHVG